MNAERRERARVRELLMEGWTMGEIGRELGRSAAWVWDQKVSLLRAGQLPEHKDVPSLARVSFLEKPHDLMPADYYAGRAALSAAGLS